MREFRAYEWVDGDLTVYVRQEGQGDDAWRPAGIVRYQNRPQAGRTVRVVAEQIGVRELTQPEYDALAAEMFNPRRW